MSQNKTCRICSTPLIGLRSHAVQCSEKCRRIAHYRKHRERIIARVRATQDLKKSQQKSDLIKA